MDAQANPVAMWRIAFRIFFFAKLGLPPRYYSSIFDDLEIED